jgi:hypothetical protein
MELDIIKYLQRLIKEEECDKCPLENGHSDCSKEYRWILICRRSLDWLESLENEMTHLRD